MRKRVVRDGVVNAGVSGVRRRVADDYQRLSRRRRMQQKALPCGHTGHNRRVRGKVAVMPEDDAKESFCRYNRLEPERFHDNRQAKGNSGTCQPPGSLESVSS